MNAAQISGIFNFRAVDTTLSTSGQPMEAQLAAVAGASFHVVINLALHNDPRYSLRDDVQDVLMSRS